MCTILSSIYLSTYRYKENDIFSPWSLLLDGSHLVPLEGEGEEGEHAHADGQGGGEGVDAAVHRPELPGAVTVDNTGSFKIIDVFKFCLRGIEMHQIKF